MAMSFISLVVFVTISLSLNAFGWDFNTNKCMEEIGEDQSEFVGKDISKVGDNKMIFKDITYMGFRGRVFVMSDKCEVSVLADEKGLIFKAHASEGCCDFIKASMTDEELADLKDWELSHATEASLSKQ